MRNLNENLVQELNEFNYAFQRANRQAPSFRHIMRELKLSSTSKVQRYVKELVRRGQMLMNKDGSIKLFPQFDNNQLTIAPLVGEIACGIPNFAEQILEDNYVLPEALFGTDKLYMLRASGNSMIDVGIYDGDLLVLKQQNHAKNGDIVVACLENETTLKRVFFQNGHIILHPENKEMQDMIVDKCSIQGVLAGSIKLFNGFAKQ